MQETAQWIIWLFFCHIATGMAAWQCPSVDKAGVFYVVHSPFIKTAVYKSLDRCKQQSASPASCLVERAYCQQIGSNHHAQSYWQCFAFDSGDKKYPSGPYRNRYQAVLSAETLCRRLSKDTSSCNVPLFTCETI